MRPIEEKAVRMVAEGRVHIRWTNAEGTAGSGTVDGDNDTYICSFDPAGRICTCPAGSNHKPCSHSLALELRVMAEGIIELEWV